MLQDRGDALRLIRRNIEESGFHIYIVSGGLSPRFAYTIGLRDSLGAELVLGGGIYYESSEDVLALLHAVREQLAKPRKAKLGPPWLAEIALRKLGKFTLRKAHPSWTKTLLLGALDYYGIEEVDAYQVVPEHAHCTIDVPDMTKPMTREREPLWYLDDAWPGVVPRDAEVMTTLDVLRGAPVMEASRWEDSYWEMFAGSSKDVAKRDGRLVPLGWLFANDPTLAPVASLAVGDSRWRDDDGGWSGA